MGDEVGEHKTGGLHIPPDFRCPLSLELMSDPVIVASGQTYERACIQQWLDQGNTSCPKTRQTLTHTNLIPNYTVKALIANWCEANNVPLPEPGKIDLLGGHLRVTSPIIVVKAEPHDRNVASSPNHAHEASPVRTTERSNSGGMSGVGSRPVPKSRRTIHPKSFDGIELDRNCIFQNGGSGDEQGEGSQATSRSYSSVSEGDGVRRGSILKENLNVDGFIETSAGNHHHQRTASGSSVASSIDDGHAPSSVPEATTADASHTIGDSSPYSSELSGELERHPVSSTPVFSEEPGSPSHHPERISTPFRRRGEEREFSLPRIVPTPMQDSVSADGNLQLAVDALVQDLQSLDIDIQRESAAQLRLFAKFNMENRIMIASSGAIRPLVNLLKSTDPKTQENAVTALLNLSINDNNKSEIASAGAIDPLVNVLKVGNAQAMENAAATLFSLSVMDENKVTIGASGAIPPLVHLLVNGTPRGKKDAATALFNLSIFHENKGRIVNAGAIKPLVELMAEPAAGMVDKAVAVLANLATIPEGRVAIGTEGGIPALVEVVEAGSQRGKENAAAALLQLCMNSHKHRAQVLQEGAIPPLVALSQSGTARAKEKASALLRHFREQRHAVSGSRPGPDRHAERPFEAKFW